MNEPSLEIRTHAHPANKAGRYLYSIYLSAKCPYPVGFRPEKEFDHFAKDVHLNEEIQVGDSEFDRAVYITSDEPETKDLLQDEAIRALILKLVSNRFAIDVKLNEIEFTILREPKTDVAANQALISQYYDDFARLKSSLEKRMVPARLNLDGKYDLRQSMLFLGWILLLGFAAYEVDKVSFYSHQLLRSEYSVYLGMIAFILSIVAFFFNFIILGKHSRTFRSLGVLSLFMAPTIFMLVFAYIPSQNSGGDFAPTRRLEAVLAYKHHGTVKGRDYYTLDYQYVDGGYVSTMSRVSDSVDFAKHVEGEKMILKVHPGKFGMQWYEIEPNR